MKKIGLIMLSMFLLTGCNVKYDLVYEGEILSESLNVMSLKNNVYDGQSVVSYIDNYYNNINIFVDYKFDPGNMSEKEALLHSDYYNKKLINYNGLYGINLNYKYKEENYYENSSLVFNVFNNIEINEDSIKAYNCKNIFANYPELDEIVVTFKTDKKVVETNSNEVKDGIYYWYINRNNYENKKIKIIIDKSINIIERTGNMNKIKTYSFIGLGIVLFFVFIFSCVKIANSNKK